MTIRRFLGHRETDLYRDSMLALVRLSGRVNPAVRIARFGIGMDQLEAASVVKQLQAGSADRLDAQDGRS